MSIDAWLALALFALVTSITPGPNNIMLVASGVNFGLRASVPHILGICAGFFTMLAATGLGLNEIFTRYPWSHTALRTLGVAYLLYLAWKVATAAPPETETRGSTGTRPLGFLGAAAFQAVNPKAWIMAVSAYSTYVPAGSPMAIIIGAAVLFTLVNLPCVSFWAAFGSTLRQRLKSPRVRRAFNVTMAVLLLVSMAPAFLMS